MMILSFYSQERERGGGIIHQSEKGRQKEGNNAGKRGDIILITIGKSEVELERDESNG